MRAVVDSYRRERNGRKDEGRESAFGRWGKIMVPTSSEPLNFSLVAERLDISAGSISHGDQYFEDGAVSIKPQA